MAKVLSRLWVHISLRRKFQLVAVLLLMLGGAVAELFTLSAIVPFLSLLLSPDSVQNGSSLLGILDRVARYMGQDRLFAACIVFAAIAFIAGLLRLVLTYVSYKFVFSLGAEIGSLIFRKILHQPYAFHIARNSSETLSAVEKVGHFTAGVLAPMMQMTIACVMVFAIFSGMLIVNPFVAMIAGVVLGGSYLGISLWAKHTLVLNSRLIANNGSLRLQYLQEGLGSIREILLDRSQDIYVEQFTKADGELRVAQAKNATLSGAPKYLIESVAIILISIYAYWSVKYAADSSNLLPTLGVLAVGAQRLLPYVQTIYSGVTSFRGNLASSFETLNLLDLPRPIADNNEDNQSVKVASLSLEDIEFKFNRSNQRILRSINVDLVAGDRIGIVGPTGSGKSTFIDILMGLLKPSNGTLRVNGKIPKETMFAVWQKRIAHVPQSIYLCDKTIAENIALGSRLSEIDEDRMQRVIDVAQLRSFVNDLPAGLSTRVGERGVQLSGGQRQRIGIARALYKDVDVLIFDEATSALDIDTESKVMNEIYKLSPDLIIIIIAHRLTTLKNCSTVYRLEMGVLTDITESFQS